MLKNSICFTNFSNKFKLLQKVTIRNTKSQNDEIMQSFSFCDWGVGTNFTALIHVRYVTILYIIFILYKKNLHIVSHYLLYFPDGTGSKKQFKLNYVK